MIWVEWAILFLVAILVTLVLVPLVSDFARKVDAVDYPSARRVNKKPIPRLGGVAMVGAMVVALSVYIFGVYVLGWHNDFLKFRNEWNVNVIGVAIGVVVIFIVGVVDDIVELKAKPKFAGQLVAACIVAASGLLLSSFHNPLPGGGYVALGWLSYPITVFYLVAFANVINLIDGLDGLAAGITSISAITLFVLCVVTNALAAAMLAVILLGACVGFLRFNFNPASIFMGDSGALTLGFMLGIISLFGSARTAMLVSLLVPVLAAGVPIMDTAIAIIRRKRAHRPIGEADKGHIHHRLMQAGYSQKVTVLIMWAWTAALAICALIMMEFDGPARIIAFAVVAGLTIYGIAKLRLLQPALMHHYAPRSHRPHLPRFHKTEEEADSAPVEGHKEVLAPGAGQDEALASGEDSNLAAGVDVKKEGKDD